MLTAWFAGFAFLVRCNGGDGGTMEVAMVEHRCRGGRKVKVAEKT